MSGLFHIPVNSKIMQSSSYVHVYDAEFFVKPMNIKKQLFWIDATGKMFPRFPTIVEIQKEVINKYVETHAISRDHITNFWMEYVDCLLSCYNFEQECPAEFKAWVYGRMCRFVLIDRRKTVKPN